MPRGERAVVVSPARDEPMHEILHSDLRVDGGRQEAEVRGLMEIEFELCQRERLPVAFLRIAVDGLERLAPTRERQDEVLRTLLDVLRSYPRTGDLYAYRDGASIAVLLPRTAHEAAELMCRLLIDAARKLAVPSARSVMRASLSIGVAAAQPDQDLWFETLKRVAEEGVSVASASGSECFVHTQLYGLHQRRLEREKPRPPRVVVATSTADVTRAGPSRAGASFAAPDAAPDVATVSSVTPQSAESFAADPLFDAQVRAEIARAGENGAHGTTFRGLEERLLALAHTFARGAIERALGLAREPHARELDRLRDEHERELDLLNRRVTKLARALEEAEEELRAVERSESPDRGVSSAYRFVQGLSAQEEAYQLKLGLLQAIVEENLALQKNLARPRSA